MFSKVNTGGLLGLDGYMIQVEADVSNGLPMMHLVGYLGSEVKEAQERVRTAIKNSGFAMDPKKITVNLSPANIRKEGSGFDLPIAIAILASYGIIRPFQDYSVAMIGELGLDGVIKPLKGTLSIVLAMKDVGIKYCILPRENAPEGSVVEGIQMIPVSHLKEVVTICNEKTFTSIPKSKFEFKSRISFNKKLDFQEVNGQPLLKRATEIAVAGQHNILYLGSAGSGKSMIARRIPSIMPPLTREEALEITKIYSASGKLPQGISLMTERPFRMPHHSISPHALLGGGQIPKPGEISLASRGVLFLDELPEFRKNVLEMLREPLEDHQIVISRIHGSFVFPAHMMLVAAMNPCPCGFYPDKNRCTCTTREVQQYLGKLSTPLLDRIDICVETAPISYSEARGDFENESSEQISIRVQDAWNIQKKRFQYSNSISNRDMKNDEIKQYCNLGMQEEAMLQLAYDKMKLSVRGCNRILKVARTIADLDHQATIRTSHLSEAIHLRGELPYA